jgi:hypothetical protein
MLAPIRPNPIIPISIGSLLSPTVFPVLLF